MADWEACFHDVLFPTLERLVDVKLLAHDPMAVEEAGVRAMALLCKVRGRICWIRLLGVRD